jgi:hypothetical protein
MILKLSPGKTLAIKMVLTLFIAAAQGSCRFIACRSDCGRFAPRVFRHTRSLLAVMALWGWALSGQIGCELGGNE